MAAPTTPATSLNSPIVKGRGLRLKFTKGDGLRRLVAITEGSSIKHPIDGVGYDGDLKYGKGDALVSLTSGSGSCYPYYPYPDPVEPVTASQSTTYVAYEGMNDGTVGIDIINLKPHTQYNVVVYEHTYYCYLESETLNIFTGFATNSDMFEVNVYDNRTRLAIEGASIAFVDSRQFVSDTGETNEMGFYRSIDMEEGRYEMSVLAANYDSKILSGLFIQRLEPRRDSYYRIFTSAGNTELGSSVERDYYRNQNINNIYLDPLNTTAHSFARYQSSANPSSITKL
tara:strand:+ start:667 stop:1521 length:855 start_codon:yes stop_codon:yes gene_type:complete